MLRSIIRVAPLRIATKHYSTAMRRNGISLANKTIYGSIKNTVSVSTQFQKLQTIRLYSEAAKSGSSLNRDEVLKRIKDVIKAFNKDTDAEKISLETAFNKDLGLDSLDTVELLVAVEEEFEIEIPDKIADDLKTVGETVEYILSNPEAN